MCATGELQETAKEFTKAQVYLKKYEEGLKKIEDRYTNMAKSDLILLLGGQSL